MVSNPLRLEGDGRERPTTTEPAPVSNPLRLEGDAEAIGEAGRIMGFLIHYGWRGTAVGQCRASLRQKFLIHYGWRGTVEKVANELVTV